MSKNKRLFFGVASMILITLFVGIVSAAENETQNQEQINKAYNWLSNSARDKFDSMGTEDIAFSLLALAYDDSLAAQARDALLNKSNNKQCWPVGSCKAKETALATIALERIGVDTEESKEWLLAQNGTPLDLVWFMQIDTPEESICTISYDALDYNITLNSKKKLNKNAGNCLILSYGNYWYKISSACYDKKFTINCDKDFVASMFYEKQASTTLYISSDTKKQSAKSDAELKISSVCIKQDSACNYEATAWTALSLVKNQDISTFLPYLVGYSENNKRYMANAFLYAITGQEDYASALLSSQKKAGYWQAESSPYSKYYDTALAMLALQEYTFDKKETAKSWLLKEQATTGETEGSWDSSKKDTSFVLYAVWPKEASYIPPYQELKCEDYGYYCEQSYNCDFDNRLTDYTCQSLQVCCKNKFEEKTRSCNDLGGYLCDDSLGYRCEGTTQSSLDGQCCMTYCTKEEINECENNGNACRDKCETGEQSNSDICPNSQTCCEAAAAAAKKKSKFWIWFLVILLIAAAVAAFIFKDKIKDKFTAKPRPRFSGEGLSPVRSFPRFTPPSTPGKIQPLQRPNQMPSVAIRQPIFQNRGVTLKRSQTDKELDETLNKLKSISEK